MRYLPCVFVLTLAGCATSDLSGPSPENPGSPLFSNGHGAAQVTAFAQNVYVGANVDLVLPALLSPDPLDDVAALLTAAAMIQETDFTVRAAALAREIDRTRPHVVGLNEISTIDVDLTAIGIPISVHEDFLPELLSALAARGLNYVVAGAVQGLTATPPLPPGLVASVIDRDVVLVDATRVTVGAGVIAQRYLASVGTIATGVDLFRGFIVIPATIEGRGYQLVGTHLDSDVAGFPPFDGLRALQMGELLSYLDPSLPTVLMGDLNDVPGSPMYQVAAGAGFSDVWYSFHPQTDGYTCCNDDDLGNRLSTLSKRIDYVFARGLDGPSGSLTGKIDRYGNTPSDRFQGPTHSLWPSDHAGLVAKLVVPAAMLP